MGERSDPSARSASVPTDREIRRLHEQHAPSRDAFDLVHTHCEIVGRVAEQLAEQLAERQQLTLDTDLVRAGSLLHDIGVYRLYLPSGEIDHANYVSHGVIGHDLLRDLGLPDRVCRFCSCHTGVGISRDDVIRQRLPLPVGDYFAESDEEELVMYADKFHSKSTPPVFLTAAAYAIRVRRFGEDKSTRFASMLARFGEPDLEPLMKEYGHALVETA